MGHHLLILGRKRGKRVALERAIGGERNVIQEKRGGGGGDDSRK